MTFLKKLDCKKTEGAEKATAQGGLTTACRILARSTGQGLIAD
jgi:hypothetical protein